MGAEAVVIFVLGLVLAIACVVMIQTVLAAFSLVWVVVSFVNFVLSLWMFVPGGG